jgi:phosphohistidine phosphatase
VYASPAQRAQQTAAALGRKFRTRDELLPGAELEAVLALVGWPDGRSPVVVIGHQPTLGQVIARLLRLPEPECPMKKGALWWLRNRERAGRQQNLLVTVQTPELF